MSTATPNFVGSRPGGTNVFRFSASERSIFGYVELDTPIAITRFRSQAARSKVECPKTLRQLADELIATKADSKTELPWFKLARFGDARTDRGSLRHNANVLAVTGVEGDYDGGLIQPGEAAVRLQNAGVCALVYTTPSHTADEPRWRAMAPFSKEHPPEDRAALWARLNGLFDGELDPASAILSQSYYGGNVAGRPAIETYLVEGTFLDLAGELEEGAIGKPTKAYDATTAGSKKETTGLSFDDFRAALMKIPNTFRYSEWVGWLGAIHHEASGADDAEAYRALAHEWSATWEGGNDPEETDRVWDSLHADRAGAKRGESIAWEARKHGWADPRDIERREEVRGDFELLEGDSEGHPLARLNERHAVTWVGNKVCVLTELPDGTTRFSTPADLHQWYANEQVQKVNSRAEEPISRAWMRDASRRDYPGGVTFYPGPVPKEVYNLWRGWPELTSIEGATCDLFLKHAREIICDGDEANFEWLIKWLAHSIQKPEEKPGTALILRGKKGAGKDSWLNYFGKLFGRHHFVVSKIEHLTGHFNAHLEETLFLHVEETFWAGDKKAEGELKSLITSGQTAIERKGFDVIQVENFSRLAFTSNADWVVPATFDERRFFVLNVSDRELGNKEYFAALISEGNNGGAAALFDYLNAIDLSGFNARLPPNTKGLLEQKLAGLKGVDAWWYDLLTTGGLPTFVDWNDSDEGWREGRVTIDCSAFRDACNAWVEERRHHGDIVGDAEFGRKLREMVPGIKRSRPRMKDGSRAHIYSLPSLRDCRKAFEARLGKEVDWGE